MKAAIKISIVLFALLANITISYAQTVPAQISLSLRTGNTTSLQQHMANTVELYVLEDERNCSKDEALSVVKNFFTKHQPNNFIVLHEGGKYAYRYIIGTLVTNNGNFRVYYLLKEENQRPLVQQLRIDYE